jgi:hypothetical protein
VDEDLKPIFTTANLNNHINSRCLVTDFSIVEVLEALPAKGLVEQYNNIDTLHTGTFFFG